MSIQKNITLRKIIFAYIDEAKQTIGEYARLRGIAMRGMVELGFDVSWSPKCIMLKVLPNKTAELPNDFLQWVRIGNFNGYSEIATLKVNNKISNFKAANTQRQIDIAPIVSDFDNNRVNILGSNYGQGVTVNYRGECTVDELNGLILLNADYQYETVVLQYISSPEQDDDYTVPIQLQEAIISWLRWKDVISIRSVGIGEKNTRKNEFLRDKTLAIRRIKPFRLQEALQSLYEKGWHEMPFDDNPYFPFYNNGVSQPQAEVPVTEQRIFDDTFDETFN